MEGYEFNPTDLDLAAFLLHKSFGADLQRHHCPILEVDVYSYRPENLVPSGQTIAYFFTKITRKSNGRRNRAVGPEGREDGKWNISRCIDDIPLALPCGAVVVVTKTLLTFYEKTGERKSIGWVMHEFELACNKDRSSKNSTPEPEWILCKIKLNPSAERAEREGKRRRQGDSEALQAPSNQRRRLADHQTPPASYSTLLPGTSSDALNPSITMLQPSSASSDALNPLIAMLPPSSSNAGSLNPLIAMPPQPSPSLRSWGDQESGRPDALDYQVDDSLSISLEKLHQIMNEPSQGSISPAQPSSSDPAALNPSVTVPQSASLQSLTEPESMIVPQPSSSDEAALNPQRKLVSWVAPLTREVEEDDILRALLAA